MNPNLQGKWFRSDPYVYSVGTTLTVKADYLAAARHMAAPEVAELVFTFTGTVGGVTGGALAVDASKLFDTIKFTDEEEVLNASGAMLRCQEILEFGSRAIDANAAGDVSSGSTNSSYVHRLRVTWEPDRAERPRDTRIPLEHFLEGGVLEFSTPAAVPTGWAAVQSDWRVRVNARVVDGRTKELKSRLTYREVAANTNQEYDYEINGSLRSAIVGSKLATTSYTSLAAYTTLFSRTLEMPPNYETHNLVDRYRRTIVGAAGSGGVNGAVDPFLASTPLAIPLLVPEKRQKIGAMIDTKTLHLDFLTTAPTSGRLLTSQIKNRTPNLAALVAGYTSTEDLQMAMATAGFVVDSTPGGSPVRSFAPTLVRRFPVRIKRTHR
jgi:hypothetical protein